MNPFIHISYYPDFEKMTPELAREAFRQLLPEAKRLVTELEQSHVQTWGGLTQPLYDACYPLTHAWGLLCHLLSVVNNDAWRNVQKELQPEMVAFSLRVGQSPLFYRSFCALQISDAKNSFLTRVQRRILEKTIQGATQAGVGLPPEKQARFNAIQTEIAQLATTFRNNVLDATKAFTLTLTRTDELAGLPADLLATTVRKTEGQPDTWIITLEASVYVPFMMHSKNGDAREKLYRAFITRASAGSIDNTPILERLLTLKRELANLLDYPTYADLSLSTKSAKTVSAVDDLIEKLYTAAYPQGVKEMKDLHAFSRTLPKTAGADHRVLLTHLPPWDIAFYAERLRESKYDYSDDELSQYFPYPKVLDGLFALAHRLFGIRIVDASGQVPVWHPDVKFYNVLNSEGTCIAGIYSDPYSRPETKSGGAWANDFCTRRLMSDGTLQRPLALMVCNQSKPVGTKPPLMRFSEVRTLFHEFGHVLQHILTTVDEPEASGLNNIEWDAVEIASQFMENWCYDRATLTAMTSHIDTGASLPSDLFKRILAAQHFRAATTIMRQVTFAATDINLYARYPSTTWKNAHAVNQACIKKYSTTPTLPEDRFLCAFSHIFGGGYAAGYYSYKWSEVMSSDAFAAFEEVGLENESQIQKKGKHFRDTFLALGGGTDPMEVFQQFRGRPPTIDALLRHAGLKH
jgi:oligopeptidase A